MDINVHLCIFMTTLENLTNKYSYQYEGKKTILIAGWAWQSNLLVISQKKNNFGEILHRFRRYR